jgi:hypothetical protein
MCVRRIGDRLRASSRSGVARSQRRCVGVTRLDLPDYRSAWLRLLGSTRAIEMLDEEVVAWSLTSLRSRE